MKSLDLQQIGLQELTTVETCSVDGGCGGLCLLAIAAVGVILYDWDDFKLGLSGGA